MNFAAGGSGRLKKTTAGSGRSIATRCQQMMWKGSSKKVFIEQKQTKASLKSGKVSRLFVTMMEMNWTLLVVTSVEKYSCTMDTNPVFRRAAFPRQILFPLSLLDAPRCPRGKERACLFSARNQGDVLAP